jgi:hypothetical protein
MGTTQEHFTSTISGLTTPIRLRSAFCPWALAEIGRPYFGSLLRPLNHLLVTHHLWMNRPSVHLSPGLTA